MSPSFRAERSETMCSTEWVLLQSKQRRFAKIRANYCDCGSRSYDNPGSVDMGEASERHNIFKQHSKSAATLFPLTLGLKYIHFHSNDYRLCSNTKEERFDPAFHDSRVTITESNPIRSDCT